MKNEIWNLVLNLSINEIENVLGERNNPENVKKITVLQDAMKAKKESAIDLFLNRLIYANSATYDLILYHFFSDYLNLTKTFGDQLTY